jgi:TPR repeat protein
MLGKMYDFGKGLSKEKKEAVKYYRMAAELGNTHAQVTLGFGHESGSKFIPLDPLQAYMWLSLAKNGGSQTVDSNIEEISKELKPEQIEKTKAMVKEKEMEIRKRKAEAACGKASPRKIGRLFLARMVTQGNGSSH